MGLMDLPKAVNRQDQQIHFSSSIVQSLFVVNLRLDNLKQPWVYLCCCYDVKINRWKYLSSWFMCDWNWALLSQSIANHLYSFVLCPTETINCVSCALSLLKPHQNIIFDSQSESTFQAGWDKWWAASGTRLPRSGCNISDECWLIPTDCNRFLLWIWVKAI